MADNSGDIIESEKGRDLCRVRGEGGISLGFRKDILTENLSKRDNVLLVCTRCQGILRDACISSSGEQVCFCCKKLHLGIREERTTQNVHVRDTVLSLKCSCPLYKRGCEWLGTLGECENHLDVCIHVHENCKLGCDIVLPRHKLYIHMSEQCLFRNITCEYCQIDFQVCEMPSHLSKCDKFPLTCELKCGTVVHREDMSWHLEKDCSRVPEKCKLCCAIELPREELNKHMNEKCVQRNLRCEHCKRDFKVYDIPNHQKECLKMPLKCEVGCNLLVCREDMARHIEQECVEKKVECPFRKYKCEVGLIKRKELNQHLKEKRTEHTELKLSAMEEIIMQQSEMNSTHNEIIRKQGESISKQKETIERMSQEIDALKTEANDLKQVSLNATKLHWRINDVRKITTPFSVFTHQEQFHADGYNIILKHYYATRDIFEIQFHPHDGCSYPSFKALFITSLICHSNPRGTKLLGSELFQVHEPIFHGYKTIGKFQRSVITAEFIKDGGIDFEIIVDWKFL